MDDDLRKFYGGLLGFPSNIFDENSPYYAHNKETLEKLSERMKNGE